MKKTIFLLSLVIFSAIVSAQILTVNVSQAGNLSASISSVGSNASTTTNLTVSGNIDARDVKFIRDNMPMFSVMI